MDIHEHVIDCPNTFICACLASLQSRTSQQRWLQPACKKHRQVLQPQPQPQAAAAATATATGFVRLRVIEKIDSPQASTLQCDRAQVGPSRVVVLAVAFWCPLLPTAFAFDRCLAFWCPLRARVRVIDSPCGIQVCARAVFFLCVRAHTASPHARAHMCAHNCNSCARACTMCVHTATLCAHSYTVRTVTH